MHKRTPFLSAFAAFLGASIAFGLPGDDAAEKPEFPPFAAVSKGLTEVVSTTDGSTPLYELWADKKEGKLLAVLPSGFENQMLMIACTVSGGDPEAGVMGPTLYAKWRRIGKQLVLVAPDLFVRTADDEAKGSIDDLFSDSVVVKVPIVAMKGGRPVMDFGSMATGQASSFFNAASATNFGPYVAMLDPSLATLTKAKSFPENFIVEYEAPRHDKRFVRVTYSVGKLEGTPGYEPRKADPRVGYFYDWHRDYAKTGNDDVAARYINRWNIEKADPSLRLSPPKEPLVWYVEHTTPVRYRRFVREGIEMWNSAFEDIGIVDAVEVRQQDEASGTYMDIDPEDARYNFFRWNMSDAGYAIGPSRTNPMTGEILDADVVWNQGLTRAVRNMLESLTDDMVETTFDAEALAWLEEHPTWDPRIRLASPAERERRLRRRTLETGLAVEHELASEEHPWTRGSNDPTNRACKIGNQLSMDISLTGLAFASGMIEPKDAEDTLDALPTEFIGGMIRYISAHEVGHTLGLQHNMAASTIHTLEEMNSGEFEGPTIASVMDYAAVNINNELGPEQGPYATPEVGPYDRWAIRFGYGPKDEVEEVLSEVGDPNHVYVSQIAMSVGSDPRNMTWDLGANNLDFADSRLAIVRDLRGKLVEEVVEDGDSWAEARRRFEGLLGTHVQALFIASTWIGGAYENYDFKGDPGGRAPIEDVPADAQRRALDLIVENSLADGAVGFSPELVRYLGKEYWWDPAGIDELMEDPNYSLHDTVAGVQALGLSLLMSPSKLRRVYDNEYRTQEEDEVTVAEIVKKVTKAVWSGEDSSFRRNLQREHVERLIDLALLDSTSPSLRTIGTLATNELRKIAKKAEKRLDGADAYTEAHLNDLLTRIEKTMEAAYVIER